MTFISYSQNFEDVMLYRALGHIERGFYIDVGAWHPVIDSVTRAFYDRGWHGINIEPGIEYFKLLMLDRPRDINLNLLVGCSQSERLFYEFPDTGLSTSSKEIADGNTMAGFRVLPRSITCTTLDSICQQYNVNTVHFLKIDVEGAEKEVLEGFEFKAIRPWIVIVEATEPRLSLDSSGKWEYLLIQKGYEHVYSDGLNRYYVASELGKLRAHFLVPPNVFDDFLRYHHYQTMIDLAQAKSEITRIRSDITNIYASHSWRATAPLRQVMRSLRGALKMVVNLVRRGVRPPLRTVLRIRRLRTFGRRLLKNNPMLISRLLALAGYPVAPILQGTNENLVAVNALSEEAQVIYDNLQDIFHSRGQERKNQVLIKE